MASNYKVRRDKSGTVVFRKIKADFVELVGDFIVFSDISAGVSHMIKSNDVLEVERIPNA